MISLKPWRTNTNTASFFTDSTVVTCRTVRHTVGSVFPSWAGCKNSYNVRDAPLGFKGGSRKFGSGQFFFLQPGKESFFLFSVPNGQVCLFVCFFLIKFVLNTRFQMKQNIICIYIKYIVVCVYCEQFVLFLSKYCYKYSFNLFEERTSCFTK